jgi:hypothetical protein
VQVPVVPPPRWLFGGEHGRPAGEHSERAWKRGRRDCRSCSLESVRSESFRSAARAAKASPKGVPYKYGSLCCMKKTLHRDEVSGHDFVYGELLIGERDKRKELLANYELMD